MKEELKETVQKTKRNKSQEPAGAGDGDAAQAWLSDDGINNSQGSLEVLADDEDEKQRLREVIGVDGEEGFLGLPSSQTTTTPAREKESSGKPVSIGASSLGVDSKKLIEAQKLQMENIQHVNLERW